MHLDILFLFSGQRLPTLSLDMLPGRDNILGLSQLSSVISVPACHAREHGDDEERHIVALSCVRLMQVSRAGSMLPSPAERLNKPTRDLCTACGRRGSTVVSHLGQSHPHG